MSRNYKVCIALSCSSKICNEAFEGSESANCNSTPGPRFLTVQDSVLCTAREATSTIRLARSDCGARLSPPVGVHVPITCPCPGHRELSVQTEAMRAQVMSADMIETTIGWTRWIESWRRCLTASPAVPLGMLHAPLLEFGPKCPSTSNVVMRPANMMA